MRNTEKPPCQIGDRIECAGFFGTVRYIGTIDGKPSTWLGIDWDEPDRGKHNGTVNGIQYFTTNHPNSGSFVRPERVNFGKSAIASIESRYGQFEDEFTTRINQQKQLMVQQTMNAPFLEMVGFDKIFNMQSDFNTLRIVNLRDQTVNSAGLKLGIMCPNVEELDVSKNLFVSWSQVFDICKQLPKLRWLNVSENILVMPEDFDKELYPNLTTLICGSMELDWDDIQKIANVFPFIEELRAPYNRIRALDVPEHIFEKLTLLDLEGNKIETWDEISKLSRIPVLEQLILDNVGLHSIKFGGDVEVCTQDFKMLKKLCLSNNLLHEWQSIGELDRLENLEHLRISKNPILETDDHETVHQIIIARIGNLKILNGVEIESGERRGAEYDYIKKYGLEWLKVKGTDKEMEFFKMHNRYQELIQKYGEPEESELRIKPKIIQSSLINLFLVYENFGVQKKVPPAMTIQKLMVLCQKLFSLKERPQLTYICSSDPNIELALEDEMKEVGVYSMQDGDQIIVRT